jgi:hypothetical protein
VACDVHAVEPWGCQVSLETIADELRVPAWALPYLVNGDDSGLSEADITLVRNWLDRWETEAVKLGGHIMFHASDNEPSFTWRPAFGLACDCVESALYVIKGGGQ